MGSFCINCSLRGVTFILVLVLVLSIWLYRYNRKCVIIHVSLHVWHCYCEVSQINTCAICNLCKKNIKTPQIYSCLYALFTNVPNMNSFTHYNDVIMSAMASQISSLTIVYSTVYSRCRSKKHQSSASLAFVRGIHRWPVNSSHKGPVTRKMFPFDNVIMINDVLHSYAGRENVFSL